MDIFGGGGGHRLGGEASNRSQYALTGTAADGDFAQAIGGNGPLIVGGCGLLAIVLAVAIAGLSLGTVPPLYYGIRYNSYSKVSDTSVIYSPGRHFIGPFCKFLLFPSDVQNIEFVNEARILPNGIRYESLHTRTQEGLGLHLQVSMQYRLIKEHIGQLYNNFNQNYEQVFSSSVRDTLIKAASEYQANDLWEERDKFVAKMRDMVDWTLRKTYAECWGLQLIFIDLPDEYEESIVLSEVQKQQLFMREQEQVSAQIRAETEVIRAEFDRKVKVMLAEGRANCTLTTKRAQAEAQQNKIDVEAEVFGIVKKELHLDEAGLVRYSKYGAMDDLQDSVLIYGFAGNAELMLQAN